MSLKKHALLLPLALSLLLVIFQSPDICAESQSDSAVQPAVNPVFEGNRMLQEYIELVQEGNLESARMHWSPYAQERAGRLGIHYDGISIKADLNSPLVKLARFHPQIALKSGGRLDSTFLRMQVEAKHNSETSSYQYYAIWLDGYPWLTFPQDYVAEGWPIQKSRYFRFHINPGKQQYVNQIAIESLDSFVDSLGKRLDISKKQMHTLAEKKIDYYYCADEQEVERITGAPVRGLYDLAADALITSALPHYHEVTHLLINYRLQSMPLTTLPLLREGMATYLGGRSTSSSSTLMDMGAYLYRLEVVDVDSLLELMAFHTDIDASISYSAAALFMKSLVETYGMEKTLSCYLALSGNLDQTRQLSSDSIRQVFENRLGASWDDITKRFQSRYISGAFHDEAPDVYLRPGLSGLAVGDSTRLSQMGLASDPLDEHVRESRFKTLRNVTLIQSGDRVFVRARPDNAGELKATILFEKLDSTVFPASVLFEEQFRDSPAFQGYRFGVRFDNHEAGVYDYATSTLLAKFLTSFDPSAPYFNPADSTVSFSFPLTLVKNVSPLNAPVILSR